MTESSYTVTGMTCGHCAGAVREEVGALAGVAKVDVDVQSGSVVVTSEAPLAVDDVRAAVEEAGYALA
ncbi:heavy-metal-associated domain-containing protein [Amycolatopsis sp. CA-230715]|uniref:heavy-metal-associated domain-containing protein n=1 Tax=Amycolatopsis sp. CA-230715 TaxID=2745196 RepID=UPI001C0232C6|nr:heavy-metal-associated domain-containing protein [Amycolatopsis sp. CA-230715]QWF81257.1 Copper chaperone CopZ [Amycolatopsis sp. CA-230715]